MVSQALRFMSGQVNQFRKESIEKFKGIQDGVKWFGRANMLIGMVGQFDNMIAKARELGTWWGAFSADGVRGVNNLGRAERELEANRRKFHELNQKRWKEEEAAKKAQESLAKTMTDLVYQNADDEMKLHIRMLERVEIAKKLAKAQEGTVEFYSLQEGYLKTENDIRRLSLQIEKDKSAELRAQKQIAEDIQDAMWSVHSAREKAGDRSRVTIDELLSDQTGGALASDKDKARRARDLEAQADALRLQGDFKGSENLLNQRDKIVLGDNDSKEAKAFRARIDAQRNQRTPNKMVIAEMEAAYQQRFGGIGSLKTSERDQFTLVKETIEAQEKHLSRLVEKADGEGINVRPHMSK